jgi:NADH-quinone oxidoreductase subunit M
MTTSTIPWLELSVLLPLAGALYVARARHPQRAHASTVAWSAASLVCALAAAGEYAATGRTGWDGLSGEFAGGMFRDLFTLDALSAPLLPLAALVYLLTLLATPRTKAGRFPFVSALISEAILLGTLASQQPWVIVVLLAAATVPPYLELRRRRQPTRVYAIHAGLFLALLLGGQALATFAPAGVPLHRAATMLLAAAMLLRTGVVPLHCWLTDLFARASFGSALLFVTPLVGAYGALRLVVPVAPQGVLEAISFLSLFTAAYAASMTLIQTDTRRFFSYLFLSHSSLVLVGLELATPVGLAGSLCLWLSVALSLTGFGLTLRCLEARYGRLALDRFHGLASQTPTLAGFFLLTGLASIGFPGTIGFIGGELLVEGAHGASDWVAVLVVLAGALNGLAVVQAYFRLFAGLERTGTIDLAIRGRERLAVVTLSLLILGGGLYPQPGVSSRYRAALELTAVREQSGLTSPPVGPGPSPSPVPHSPPAIAVGLDPSRPALSPAIRPPLRRP